MNTPIRVVVIGCGHMGSSHARAYAMLDGFELSGLVARGPKRRARLAEELGGTAQFDSLGAAIKETQPQAVAICTYPDSHGDYAIESLKAGLHVFVEKPIAQSVEKARHVVDLSTREKRKVVVGYILRHHPAWEQFIEIARKLGNPLVMRMNLNQQSKGSEWESHKQLMHSMSPIVDCGVHYVDVMCQMTRCRPVRVQAIGARLSDEIDEQMYNYGQLQVIFEDGSVGWYEAGWGPMMSETAFFVKDVVGPQGSVSMVEPDGTSKASSDNIDGHTKTNRLVIHYSQLDTNGNFVRQDIQIDTTDEPDHQELCNREQAHFLRAIREDLDLTEHLQDAVESLRIVLAAHKSVRTGQVVTL